MNIAHKKLKDLIILLAQLSRTLVRILCPQIHLIIMVMFGIKDLDL
jgi:hypothetical protein